MADTELEKPLDRMAKEEKARQKKEAEEHKREAKVKWWKNQLEEYDTVLEYLFAKARETGGIYGDIVISPALIDQIVTLNPVALEGQAEIIFNVFMYRLAKWHYLFEKADELIRVTPVAPPAFAPMLAQKEKLEGHIKAGLASAAQAVADYELLKHDERKYREILDYFKMGEKDQHVLRALYIDRVDAYMGEGYSMVTMTKRWPTIIGDFLKMQDEWTDTKLIREKLRVTNVEANVLKTKNELFKEWKKLFFPDVRERYGRIKNLLDSRKRSVDEYREWLKPYFNKLKLIREESELKDAATDFTDPLKFGFTPNGEVNAKLWFWKPIRPEETGKPLIIQGWGEIPIFDDWVKDMLPALEAKYEVKWTEKEVKKFVAEKQRGTPSSRTSKRKELLTIYPAQDIDERFLYYFFVDLDYQCQYKKGSTGPMVIEDQYWHFHPFLLSKNVILFMLLELASKNKKLKLEIEKIIGVKSIEDEYIKKAEEDYRLKSEHVEKDEKKTLANWKDNWEGSKISWKARRRKLKKTLQPLLKFFFKPGPYEINVAERVSKTYGLYFGAQVEEMRELIKETAYRISGQRP
ncbi:MAG: hypothetical protein NTU57_03615 [Candidatus Aenigmarchaeota archaeon]|nr:hypothetical protein [Candidatus Aenigmarchaeota archaeon]